jgi:hypothetical protein
MYIMTESAADGTALENACRDIDRYVSETAQPSSTEAQSLSPSQRLRELGRQQAGSSTIASPLQEIATPPSAQETATPLLANEF